MSTSVSFYTSGPMEKAHQHSTSNTQNAERALDFNPDVCGTFLSGNPYLRVDLASSSTDFINRQAELTVDAAVVFLSNYDNSTSDTVIIGRSSNGTSFTQVATKALYDTTTPLRVIDFSTATYRYWEIKLSTSGDAHAFGLFMLCKKYTVSQANELPQQTSDRFHNKIYKGQGGRQYVRGLTRRNSQIIPRAYKFFGTTNWLALQNAFLDSSGRRFPLVLQEGTVDADARLVRFAKDQLNENQKAYQYYEPKVLFEELPYITAGENY